MAVTAVNVVNFESSTNANNYTTGSWTPVANRLYLLVIATSGTFRTVSSFTDGTGLNWVSVDTTGAFNTSYNVSVYRAMKPSGLGAGTTKVTLSGTASRGQLVITEFNNVDTGGTDGSSAVVQSKNGILASAGTSLSLTLPSSIGAGNATWGGMATNLSVDTGISPGGSYGELSDIHVQTPASESQETETEFLAAGSTTVNWTFTSSTAGGVGVEIKVAASGPTAVSDTDSGSGTDVTVNPIGVAIAPETGTGSEAIGTLILGQLVDAGTGSEGGAALGLALSETGTGTDVTGTFSATVRDSDTGTGAEGVPQIALVLVETGTGTETSSVLAFLGKIDTDTGTLTELVGGIALTGVTDVATALESLASIGLSHTDTGTGSESQPALGLSGPVDTGTGVESLGPIALVLLETGAGLDAQTIAALLQESDTGTDTESDAVQIILPGVNYTGVLLGILDPPPRLTGNASVSPRLTGLLAFPTNVGIEGHFYDGRARHNATFYYNGLTAGGWEVLGELGILHAFMGTLTTQPRLSGIVTVIPPYE